MPRVKNGRDASLAVLSFFLVPFLILSENLFFYTIFYRSISGLKMVSDWLSNKRQLGVIFPLVSQS